MNADFVVLLAREGLQTIAMLAFPMLIASLAVGLVVSFVQAVTQMQDQTLSFIPKIASAAAALYVCGPWMLSVALRFTHHCIEFGMRVRP